MLVKAWIALKRQVLDTRTVKTAPVRSVEMRHMSLELGGKVAETWLSCSLGREQHSQVLNLDTEPR